jgi:hypothetical protein
MKKREPGGQALIRWCQSLCNKGSIGGGTRARKPVRRYTELGRRSDQKKAGQVCGPLGLSAVENPVEARWRPGDSRRCARVRGRRAHTHRLRCLWGRWQAAGLSTSENRCVKSGHGVQATQSACSGLLRPVLPICRQAKVQSACGGLKTSHLWAGPGSRITRALRLARSPGRQPGPGWKSPQRSAQAQPHQAALGV